MPRFFFITLALVAILPACVTNAGLDEADNGHFESERFSTQAPTSRTGLSPHCFWHDDTQLTLRVYGAQPLLDESGKLRAPHVLPSGCNDVPSYVVRCALPAGEKVLAASGEVYEGRFGLAPGWLDAKLSSEEQRFVTACLLQHLADGREASFALEGQSPALEGALQSSQPESILGGNLFLGGTAPVGSAAFRAFACVDEGLRETCDGAAEEGLRARLCGTSAKCGLEIVGSCLDACDFDENGALLGCRGDMTNEALRMQVDANAMSTLHADACR